MENIDGQQSPNPTKKFRIVEQHRLHVTEKFLDELKELFRAQCHYDPAHIHNMRAYVILTDTNEIVIKSLDANEEIRKYPSMHRFSARRVLVWESGDKGHIVTLSSDSLRSRDIDNKNPRNFQGHKSRLTCMMLSNDEAYEDARVVSGSDSGLILIHSLKSSKMLFTLSQHAAPIVSICFTFGIGNIPLIASMDKADTIILWEDDDESANPLRILSP